MKRVLTRQFAAGAGLAVLLAFGMVDRAWAGCAVGCTNYNPPGNCTQWENICTGDSHSTHSYGAIAYSRASGAWGVSETWGSQDKAESYAMKKCAEKGNGCKVIVWFDRGCGAVVSSEDATTFWSLGDSEGQARADALKKCAGSGSKNCVAQAYHCSN